MFQTGEINIKALPDNCEILINGTFVDYPPVLKRALAAGQADAPFGAGHYAEVVEQGAGEAEHGDAGLREPLRVGDEVVPVASAHELAAASPTAELLVHPEAGHRFAEPSHRRWPMKFGWVVQSTPISGKKFWE